MVNGAALAMSVEILGVMAETEDSQDASTMAFTPNEALAGVAATQLALKLRNTKEKAANFIHITPCGEPQGTTSISQLRLFSPRRYAHWVTVNKITLVARNSPAALPTVARGVETLAFLRKVSWAGIRGQIRMADWAR